MDRVPNEVPRHYDEPTYDFLRLLQWIADFFPPNGRGRETLEMLYRHRDQLKLDAGVLLLIQDYHWALHEMPRTQFLTNLARPAINPHYS